MPEQHVIAEAGTNHNGNLDTAKQLVDIALAAGADSVKFQIIYPEGLYVPTFLDGDSRRANPSMAARRASQLSDGDYEELWAYANARNLAITASVFDQRGISLVDRLGVPYIKLASCDLNNDGLIRAACETGRRLILATGMSSLSDIEHAVDVAGRAGTTPVLLHCVSIYPTPVERANVTFVRTLRDEFGTEVGYSDHTESDVAAVAAAALGATWFEKHFTQDRSQQGFDHAYAMEPQSLARYINSVRQAARALAIPGQKLSASEADVASVARRGLFAARDLSAGEKLRTEDILVVRPTGFLRPRDLGEITGRTLVRPVARHAPLSWDDVNVP